jgi:LacI family repressor for deo operon, udp, cdd, tsx, nupC, and nupG
MSATLEQISKKAGFSVMTVSRALRGIGRVNRKTREDILAVARELGYPGLDHVVLPRSIRRGHADHQLSLVVASMDFPYGPKGPKYSYLSEELQTGLRERMNEIGGRLKVVQCCDLEDIKAQFDDSVHGLVLRSQLPNAWVDELRRQGPVLHGASYDYQQGVDSIYTNEHRSAAMAVNYLAAHGHRHVFWFGLIDYDSNATFPPGWRKGATVSDWLCSNILSPRYAAWAYLAQCQLNRQSQPMLLLERDWAHQSLEEVVEEGLRIISRTEPRPTAVVVPTDAMGLALVNAIRKAGLQVPQDLSVLSYCGFPEAKAADPPLTTIELPMRLIGRTIPELIERRLANPRAVPVSMQLETTLFEGGTVARLSQDGVADSNHVRNTCWPEVLCKCSPQH